MTVDVGVVDGIRKSLERRKDIADELTGALESLLATKPWWMPESRITDMLAKYRTESNTLRFCILALLAVYPKAGGQ
jgi:hypothetical protein